MKILENWLNRIFLGAVLIVGVGFVGIGAGRCTESLTAVRTDSALTIDGMELEGAWENTQPVVIHDKIASIDITIKALYNEHNIYILVRFPDPDENRTHKSWVWNKSNKMYEMGHDREDVFVIKWLMEFDPQALSVFSGKPHKADIWYWKANRTDPTGYADDKIQVLQTNIEKRATKITGSNDSVLYLLRKGDTGDAAYVSTLAIDYKSDRELRFENVTPTGSRADIIAKGKWMAGEWVIEFQRALNTGHDDDLALELNRSYILGLSTVEIAGRMPKPEAKQPLFGSGDIHQAIRLSFKQ